MKRSRIAVLLGDAAGVGPEIVAKALTSGTLQKLNDIVIIGDKRVLKEALRQLDRDIDIPLVYRTEDLINTDVQLYHLEHPEFDLIEKGKVQARTGEACYQMILATADIPDLAGIVYAPFNKGSLKLFNDELTSEISIFKKAFNIETYCSELNVVDGVWSSRITSHVPIKKVSENLTIENVLRGITVADEILLKAGIEKPRIGVACLNPHCGEGGLTGDEEITIINPAIDKAREAGIDVRGPYSSDILFVRAFEGELDLCVTMYHDQGQIALKLRGFDRGVTVLAGFPIAVCTPAHGTAFDIVGTNTASVTAFSKALEIVSELTQAR